MLNSHKIAKLSVFFAAALMLIATAYSAYKGHANDRDINAILSAYPNLKNTAVNSCITFHKSGKIRDTEKPQGARHENGCGYCHAIYVKSKGDIKETLNSYGIDYLAAGRGPEAVRALALRDSDKDGYSNEVEFAKGTNPGESACQDKAAPEHRFSENYDHNGGRSSFAIVAIGINPLPKGTRDFEWEKVRDQFVAEKKLAIFGALKVKKGK